MVNLSESPRFKLGMSFPSIFSRAQSKLLTLKYKYVESK